LSQKGGRHSEQAGGVVLRPHFFREGNQLTLTRGGKGHRHFQIPEKKKQHATEKKEKEREKKENEAGSGAKKIRRGSRFLRGGRRSAGL